MKPIVRLGLLLTLLLSMGGLSGCELISNHDDGDDGTDAASPTKPAAGDRQKIIGAWKVVTPDWRWSKMTFNADGTRSVVDRVSGETLHRGTWRLENGKLVVVSDVTEAWTYSITATTLNVTLPSGTRIQMIKITKSGS